MKSKLEFAEIGFFQCDKKGKILALNNVAYETFSLHVKFSSIEEVINKNLTEIYDEYKEIFKKITNEGSLKNYESYIEFLDGKKRYLLNNCIVINENLYEIIFVEISHQKELERKLVESERRMHSIIDIIPDIVYRVNPSGEIIFISDSIKNYGYEPEDLIGQNILEIVHPDDKDKSMYKINDRRTGDRKTRFFEIRLLSKAHKTIPFEIEDNLVNESFFSLSSEGLYGNSDDENNVFLGTQGIARDISFRKKSELVLQRTEEHWKSIIETLDDGYYETDLEGSIRYINSSMANIIGYPKEEIIGKKYSILLLEKSDDLTQIFKNVYNSQEPERLTNLKVKRKDGVIRDLEGSISLMLDVMGNPFGFIGMIRDITDQKRLEQELLRARKLEAIGIFSGGIAHDYNNALTAIIGNLTLAKMELDSNNNQGLFEILDDAEKASLRMKDLTQQLSSFSKGGRPVKQSISLKEIIDIVLESLVVPLDITCDINVNDQLWQVEADKFQLIHVIENIIQNAIEAMKDRGIVVINVSNSTVREEASHHEIFLMPGDYVLISIKDSGPGIPEDEHYNIFDPYYTTKEMSSGMGLALSYAIIKRHHGYIDFVSKKGNGTEFLVYLPVSKD